MIIKPDHLREKMNNALTITLLLVIFTGFACAKEAREDGDRYGRIFAVARLTSLVLESFGRRLSHGAGRSRSGTLRVSHRRSQGVPEAC